MEAMTPNQPPSGLPPFPPVPQGYDRWVYHGLSIQHAGTGPLFDASDDAPWERVTEWPGQSYGDMHYIEAVKDGTECEHNWIKGTGAYYCGKCLATKDDSEPVKRWVYHYAARKSNSHLPEHIDCSGILTMEEPITTNEQYHRLVYMALNQQKAATLSITSLSLLHGPA